MQFPRWLSWLFVGFLAYLLYIGNFTAESTQVKSPPSHTSATYSPAVTEVTEAKEPATEHASTLRALDTLTDGARWRRAINPGYVGDVNATDSTVGNGEAAACGDQVTILLRGTLSDGAAFDKHHQESSPLTFRLGNAPYKALNEGILGMRAGGVRLIRANPLEVFTGEAPNLDSVLLRVELQKVTTPGAAGDLPLTVTEIRRASDADTLGLRCGDARDFAIQRFDAAGKALAEETVNNPLNAEHYGSGIAQAAHGLQPGEVRLAIIPAGYGKASNRTEIMLLSRPIARAAAE
jgi:hypothetical protein